MRDASPPSLTSHPGPKRRKHARTTHPHLLILPPTPPVRSARAATIVRWFGLEQSIRQRAQTATDAPPTPVRLDLASGTITLLTGPSGAGKSSLLRDIQRASSAPDAPSTTWIDLASIALPDVPIVDCFTGDSSPPPAACGFAESHAPHPRAPNPHAPGLQAPDAHALNPHAPDAHAPDLHAPDPHAPDAHAPLRQALLDLARVGLAEAWTYLRHPAELSDGQRWRLRLALALETVRRITRANPVSRVVLVADEFAALLDRVTACVVARSLRRMIAPGATVSALVATSHQDLLRSLAPDVIVRCDFGRITVKTAPTILHGPAARGFADQLAPESTAPDVTASDTTAPATTAPDTIATETTAPDTIAPATTASDMTAPVTTAPETTARTPARETTTRFHSTRPDARSRERKNPNPGGPMRKIIIASVALLALCSSALRADPPRDRRGATIAPRGGNDRLLLEPRSPFAPPRNLLEFDPRPSRRPIMPLYPTIERELDRGAGRIESDLEFELRMSQRRRDEGAKRVPKQREFERFEEARDRTLRIQQQERRAKRDLAVEQRVEVESQRLAAERARFYKSAGIDLSGAAADTAALRRLERAYQLDVSRFRRDRALEIKRLAKQKLSDESKRLSRLAIDQRFGAAQTERRERYAQDRARLLNNE